MGINEGPVEPARFIVLGIGIVVAALASPSFVAHEDHRHANGKDGDGEKILHLPIAQLLYGRIVGWTFDAAIPAAIVIRAVSVVLAIGFIVLPVIGNKVVESEPVVAGHEIDALFCFTKIMPVDLGASYKAVCETACRALVTPEKAAEVIAEIVHSTPASCLR